MEKFLGNLFRVLLALLMIPMCVSCGDDDDSVPSITPPKYESVSGKYEIVDSSSPYQSIELSSSGNYIIVKREAGQNLASSQRGLVAFTKKVATRVTTYGNIIYGTFTQVDEETFELKGFGVFQLKQSDNQVADIIIRRWVEVS